MPSHGVDEMPVVGLRQGYDKPLMFVSNVWPEYQAVIGKRGHRTVESYTTVDAENVVTRDQPHTGFLTQHHDAGVFGGPLGTALVGDGATTEPDFQTVFTQAMWFPHMNDSFPSLKQAV